MNAGAIVIVGAGQAGGWAATLRDRGYDGRIVLLGDEPHAPYERPPLSKAVLSGQALAESTELFAAHKLESMGIEFEPGVAALRLRVADRRVDTSAGQALAYDKLILCTGGRPTVPALPGVDHDGVHVLRTRADAERLRARLGPDRHVLIVGGGWIGLEVAATARQSGSKVTVLEREARLCARSVQPGVSAHLATLHAANGVALRLNAGLRAVGGSADGRPVAELADGSSIAADAIVLGVGLTPNDALARDAGIACDRGVLVDERCRTSAPDVYAAGDVAVSRGPAAAACGWSPGRTRRIRARRRRCRRWAWAKRIGRPARSGRTIRRHGADRRLSGAGGQRGAAAAGGCPRAAVGGAGCGRPRRGGRDSERGARTAPAA